VKLSTENRIRVGFAATLAVLGVTGMVSLSRGGASVADSAGASGLAKFLGASDQAVILTGLGLAAGALVWLGWFVFRELARFRRLEELNAQTQACWRSAWDQAQVAMRLTDAQGRLVLVNDAYCRFIGKPRMELEGKPFTVVYAADRSDTLMKEFWAAFSAGQSVKQRSAVVTLWDGRRCELEVADTFLELPGRPPLLLSEIYDASARVQAERNAALYAQTARELAGAATRREAAEIIVAAAKELLGWDACFLHLYDKRRTFVERTLSRDTINGQEIEAEFGPADLLPSPTFLEVMRDGGKLILRDSADETNGLITFGDRGRRSRSIMFVPVRNAGDAIGVLSIQSYQERAYDASALNVLQSLADHCAGALQRIRVEENLHLRERRFRTLIENASDVITTVNAEATILYQSPSVASVLGYPPEEMLGRNALEYIHPEDQAKVVAAIRRGFAVPSGVTLEEFRLRHKDETWRVLQSVGRYCHEEGEEPFLIVNSRDVTDRKLLEDQLRQAQKMEAIGQLAGGVAHDFNNMLAVIQLQAGMLKADATLTALQAEMAGEIEKAALRAADLTRQLLLFSRRQTLQPRSLELNELVRNITKMLQRILGEHIRIQISFAPGELFVHADPGMLDQVVMNLSVNSRDAMPDGGQLVIETSAVDFDEAAAAQYPAGRAGAFACLRVTDTGSGIAPEILPRIFEPFFTTKDVGKGTGLGLATVFGVVQQHGGWLHVTSDVGRGSTFQIYLPRRTVVAGKVVASDSIARLRGGHETILVAEDEPALRALVRSVLTRLGYRVLEAPTGVRALEIWRENRDDIRLLLTDMVMPDGISGRELATQLLAANPGLKVIYTSGYNPELATKNSGLREGVDFLAKPFAAPKLAEVVRAQLDEAAATSGETPRSERSCDGSRRSR